MTKVTENLEEKELAHKYGVLLQSFTEPGRKIRFHEGKHVYTDMDTGKTLISATTHIKKYKEPFDSVKIARMCENRYKWGVDYKKILSMWEDNGEITSSMGTSLHLIMELWSKHKELGQKIQENTGRKENPALPKHPLIRKIILDFEEINKYGPDYTVLPEAFVTHGKYCGLVDLLYYNEVTKEIRIGDYKFNIKANEKGQQTYLGKFSWLPTTKVSGYRLQMSFYAELLKQAGWKVVGMDAYIYEGKWVHVEMEVLEGVLELPDDPVDHKDRINIVNLKNHKGDVMRCCIGTPLGNPFKMKNEKDRDRVCEEYEEYLYNKIYKDKDAPMRKQVADVVVKAMNGDIVNLGCYCAPLRCHCESIKVLVLDLISKK